MILVTLPEEQRFPFAVHTKGVEITDMALVAASTKIGSVVPVINLWIRVRSRVQQGIPYVRQRERVKR